MNYKPLLSYFFAVAVTMVILFFPYLRVEKKDDSDPMSVRVLTYSSFLQSWGAGPEIARMFKEETGLNIKWVNAGNAGLLIERLRFKRDSDRPDMVIGFDQFSIHEARKSFEWVSTRDLMAQVSESRLPMGARFGDFLAYDWGPLTFVYKEGEIEPPQSLEDLASPRFKSRLILQDPRMSSPGLQFLLWVLTDMGEEKGFEFLKKLQPSIKMMSPSWSSSYSIFKMEQPTLVFSYFTSPFFHIIEEKDETYKAVSFKSPHPIQVEYAGIPRFCHNCDGARKLASFLLKPEVQKILMEKNYMYPVEGVALKGSQIHLPQGVRYYQPIESVGLIKKKRELINKWKKVFY